MIQTVGFIRLADKIVNKTFIISDTSLEIIEMIDLLFHLVCFFSSFHTRLSIYSLYSHDSYEFF